MGGVFHDGIGGRSAGDLADAARGKASAIGVGAAVEVGL